METPDNPTEEQYKELYAQVYKEINAKIDKEIYG